MEVLMSFYKDREEEKEEDGEFRKKKSRMYFVSEYKVVFFPLPIYSCFLLYYLT
jgi:hypothetical protein